MTEPPPAAAMSMTLHAKMIAVTESFIGVTETVKEIDPEAPTAPVLGNGMPRVSKQLAYNIFCSHSLPVES